MNFIMQSIAEYKNFQHNIKGLILSHPQAGLDALNTTVRMKPILNVSDLQGFNHVPYQENASLVLLGSVSKHSLYLHWSLDCSR
jgi:hypothetical protein